MLTTAAEIIQAALKLPPAEQALIVESLLESLGEGALDPIELDDAAFLEELKRRASDTSPLIPVSELWETELPPTE